MNFGIRTYSSAHKVRSCFPTLVKPRIISPRMSFAVPDRSVYVDTYGFAYYTYAYTYGGTSYTIDYNQGSAFDDQPITGVIIMHEVGNGVNDSLLNKVILEAMPDSSWRTYDYTTTADPFVYVNLRSSSWVDSQGENIVELVDLNMDVKGGLNPFCSVMQTPNVEGTGDRVTFNGDDIYSGGTFPDTQGKPVESLVLLAPMNTKFRRCTIKFQSKKVAVIRSITVFTSEYQRRGWG